MNSIAQKIISIAVLIPVSILIQDQAFAQERPLARDPMGVSPRGTYMTPDNGLIPATLEDMVESADIILQGTYGEFLRNFTFYGYDFSGNDKESPELGQDRVKARGIPISEYVIHPGRILKGADLIADPLVLRVLQMPGNEELPAWKENREGNHLFFFAINPDLKTVGLNGSLFDMKEVGDTYAFVYNGLRMTALGSYDKVAFMRDLQLIIESEKK